MMRLVAGALAIFAFCGFFVLIFADDSAFGGRDRRVEWSAAAVLLALMLALIFESGRSW